MRAKLIKAYVGYKGSSCSYCDDYGSAASLMVSEQSEWEEIDEQEYEKLKEFTMRYNLDAKNRSDFMLLVVDQGQSIPVRKTLQDIRSAEEERMRLARERIEEEKRKRALAKEKRDQKNAADKVAKLQAQLEQAKKALAPEKSKTK